METTWFYAQMFNQIFEEGEFPSGIIITFQVMAVSRVSARDPYSISTTAESCEKELGVHPPGAGHPDGSDGWRILQPTNAGEVRGAVRTPVAKEGNYRRLPILIFNFSHALTLYQMRHKHPISISRERAKARKARNETKTTGYCCMSRLSRLSSISRPQTLRVTTLQSWQRFACLQILSVQLRRSGRRPHIAHNLCTRPD
jgi:hypothetical protein